LLFDENNRLFGSGSDMCGQLGLNNANYYINMQEIDYPNKLTGNIRLECHGFSTFI